MDQLSLLWIVYMEPDEVVEREPTQFHHLRFCFEALILAKLKVNFYIWIQVSFFLMTCGCLSVVMIDSEPIGPL